MAGREVELLTDRDQARKKLHIFAGVEIPATIVVKEIIDNEIDCVSERGFRANSCTLRLGPRHFVVFDNGAGISTSVKEGTNKTHLWLACAKMFSSSNYDGVADSAGTNGVGLTVFQYTSKRCTIAVINKDSVQCYRFFDGFQTGTEECLENVRTLVGLTDEDVEFASSPGDCIRKPLNKEEFVKKVNAPYEIGFMVEGYRWETPNALFEKDADIQWLEEYIKIRAGEIASGEVILEVYDSDDFEVNAPIRKVRYVKEQGDADYVKSWLERVEEAGATVIKNGPWQIALNSDPMEIKSVVQGCPVNVRMVHRCSIEIQDYNVQVQVPMSLRYVSTDQPPYTDQTKVDIRFPYKIVGDAFERSGEVYKFFYREAEKAYMDKVIKDSDSSMFWPALEEPEELIIAEGYSAISGLKSQRDPRYQACIALRGKILNCWNLDMQKAMRAEVVKQILNAVIYTHYKRIVIAVDADYDGAHICGLLLALLARFTNLIQDGKVFMVHTPHYLFKKRGADLKWGDDANECPKGYHVTTLKGLGGMENEEVYNFIMNPDSRELVRIEWDENAYENLDHAFSLGGEMWIA